MLTITDKQFSTLRKQLTRRFAADVAGRLRSADLPAILKLDDAAVIQFVLKGVQRARGYGITLEADVEAYVERMAEHGPSFELLPQFRWLRAILNDESVPGPEKMEAIETHEALAARSGGDS